MISKILKDALRSKGWSISQAAKECDVDRSFLGRLIQGKPPPRSRSGRQRAEHDHRYRKVAVAFELDPEKFIEAVKRAQLGGEEIDLAVYYPEFRKVLQTHLPIRTEVGILRLLRAGLESEVPERALFLYDEVGSILKNGPNGVVTYNNIRDYLGVAGAQSVPLRRLDSRNRRLCKRIGETLLEIDGASTLQVRIRLSALFLELAAIVADG